MNDTLRREEIAELLDYAENSGASTDLSSEQTETKLQPYFLGSEERIVRGRMPALELVHDRFARALRTTLSSYVGKTLSVEPARVEMKKFGVFSKKLSMPSSLHLFRMPPLSGFAVLEISTTLVFAIVESIFGGSPSKLAKAKGREFSAIENRIIGKVVPLLLEDLKAAWLPLHSIDVVYTRSEYNPLALSLVSSSELAILLSINVEVEGVCGELTVCIPYSVVEPIKQKLASGAHSGIVEQNSSGRKRLERGIRDASVTVGVELGRGRLKTADALELKIGDVISLDTAADEPAIVTIEGKPKYLGRVGEKRGSRSVQLVGSIRTKR